MLMATAVIFSCRINMLRWVVRLGDAWTPGDAEWSFLLSLIPADDAKDVTRFKFQVSKLLALILHLDNEPFAVTRRERFRCHAVAYRVPVRPFSRHACVFPRRRAFRNGN